MEYNTHRFCCLGKKDEVYIANNGSMLVHCLNGESQIQPSYYAQDSIQIGLRTIPLTVKEPISEVELSEYHKLEDYHYRGKVLHGRRAPLVITSNDPLLPNVLGFIELTTAFMMSKPRSVLFDHSFDDGLGVVSWQRWDRDASQKFTNVVVRIARCVVSPEFRGLGLAGLLVRHAISFSQEHWQVAKLKPLFLEITADMLRYVPFVESAGMHYIGDTEGNLNRVQKDMQYILSNYDRVESGEILNEKSAGIVDLQVQYASCLKRIETEQGISQDDLLNLLINAPHKLSDSNWELLHNIFRLPKPTFLIGLSTQAENFIISRKKQLHLPKQYPSYYPHKLDSILSSSIHVSKCSLQFDSLLVRTKNTRKVQQAFGVNRDMLCTKLFKDISFDINPGDVVLLCGPSGAGKTTLLNLLKQQLTNPDKLPEGCSGEIKVPTGATVKILEPLRNSQPLVNSLGHFPFEHTLYALNISGLAEAHLYIKHFNELSNGQRYRAMVAKLIASGVNIWIADEFCATLDPITANIVSKNIRRCAKRHGVTVILAAANWSEFIYELKPDKIIHLRSPWDYRVFYWDEFKTAIQQSDVFKMGIASENIDGKNLLPKT